MSNQLFKEDLDIVNAGLKLFADTLADQNIPVTHVDWRPPAGGNKEAARLLDRYEERINAANDKVLQIYNDGQPVLLGVKPAHTVLEGLDEHTIFHAGPPVQWDQMCGSMQGAILGAARFEGLSDSDEQTIAMVKSGEIKLSPNHHHHAVGPMTGMITYHMPLFVVKNEKFGNFAYCAINEGLGKVLRFGANDKEVIDRLLWFRDKLAPILDQAIQSVGGINLKVIIAQALTMGDELHQRNIAASSLFTRKICPLIAQLAGVSEADKAKAIQFICGNDQFFLNLAMASAKSITDPAHGVKDSSIVTVMCRNGTDFGVKVAATGEDWFVAQANMPEGLYFPGYGPEDANRDMGDSAILEVIGLGGVAMAASPAVVRFVGAGSQDDAVRYTQSMGTISYGRSTQFLLATMNFDGTPLGIDIRKVMENDIVPVINTGIAHRLPGVGQIGAGVVKAPHDCFEKALAAFVKTLKD